MKKENLIYQYTIFGILDSFYLSIHEHLDEFNDYKKEIAVEVLANGNAVNYYVLKKDDVSVFIHTNRIDFQFKDIDENSCNKLKEYLTTFCGYFDIINRLALNCNYFYKDDNDNLLNALSLSTKLLSNFDKTTEFSIRKNNPFNACGVKFNDITLIQSGNVQENKTFNLIKSLLVFSDINTAIGVTQDIKFEKDSDFLMKLFEEMHTRLISKRNEIDKFFSEVTK